MSVSTCIHTKTKANICIPFINLSLSSTHKCWLCGYLIPRRLSHKQSDKQKQPYEQASWCKQSSSQTSMGQTWLKSKQHWFFYLCAPEPNKQLFPRAASHCRMCQYQYSLNNQTADRWQNTWDAPEALWTITRSWRGCLHFLKMLLLFTSFLPSLSFSPACTQYKHIHTHIQGLRQQCKPEDIQTKEIICQPFTPRHQICRAATGRA